MERLKEIQQSKTLAHVVPLFVFMAFLPLSGLFKIDNDLLPWYRYAPEQWVYPLQTIVCFVVLWFFRKHYAFRPFRGFFFATVISLVGIALWVLPPFLYEPWGAKDWPSFSLGDYGIWEYFGFAERKEGFDPSFFQEHTFWYVSALVFRFLRMVVVVAFVEEIFWRGFLLRHLVDREKEFWKIPFGSATTLSFIVTTVLFALVHHPTDWVVALIFGALANWVAIQTKSLAACVWLHALANLVLGIYILKTEQWGLW